MRLDPVAIVRPEGRVTITLEAFEEGGELICGIYKLKGRITCPPRRFIAVVGEELRRIERIAQAAGCVELRLCGRDWSRVLKGYASFPALKNGLRKRLG